MAATDLPSSMTFSAAVIWLETHSRSWRRSHSAVAHEQEPRSWTRRDFRPSDPDLDDLLAQDAPAYLRGTHYTVAMLLLSLIVIASLTDIDMIVSASGRLTTDAPTIAVQPMQLSVVRDILAKPGQSVRRGDVLARLDPTFTQADQDALLARRAALTANVSRLEAELAGNRPEFGMATSDSILQNALYSQRISQYQAHLQALSEDIKRLETSILAAERNRASMLQQLEVAREVEAMRARLYRLQVGSKLNHLDSQVVRMHNDRDVEEATTRLDELTHSLAAKQAERQVFQDDWRRQLLEELVKARSEFAAIAASLSKATRLGEFVSLTAPIDAVVLDVGKRSIGSVVQAAEPLITLVPAHADLVAELMIGASDVGYAHIGDEVAIKMDAFPYQRHGVAMGRLRSVGQESLSPAGTSATSAAGGQPLFQRGHVDAIAIDHMSLPGSARLTPGMTLTAEIKVGSRRVISYFLYPITRGLSESLREP
jgi:hemolysin D